MKRIPREIFIGFFGLLAMALLYWGILWLKGNPIFKSTSTYYIIYEEINGLTESSDVQKDGFRIGQVTSITYDHKAQGLLVQIDIDPKFKLPKYTTAEIFADGLMGTKAIRLDFGQFGQGFHTPDSVGEFLNPAIEQDIKDRVAEQFIPVKEKAEELMLEMQRVLENVKYLFNDENKENLTKSFASIKRTLVKLETSAGGLERIIGKGSSKVDTILNNVNSITANFKKNNDQINNIIQKFDEIGDSLDASRIAGIITSADKALTKFDDIVTKIKNGEGTLGLLVGNDSLYNELNRTSVELDKLIHDINYNDKDIVKVNIFKGSYSKNIEKDRNELYKLREKYRKDSSATVLEKILLLEEKLRQEGKLPEPQKKDGSTSYNSIDNNKVEQDKILFTIQVKSSKEPIPLTASEFKGYSNLHEFYIDGWYKYTIGSHHDLKQATIMQNNLREEFSGAFVIALKDGESIPVSQAKKEIYNN